MVTILIILPMSIFKRIFLWKLIGSDVALNALLTVTVLGGMWCCILFSAKV